MAVHLITPHHLFAYPLMSESELFSTGFIPRNVINPLFVFFYLPLLNLTPLLKSVLCVGHFPLYTDFVLLSSLGCLLVLIQLFCMHGV